MKLANSNVFDAVIETLQLQNRDLRSVSLDEAKQLTLEIIIERKQKAAKLQHSCELDADLAKRLSIRRASLTGQC